MAISILDAYNFRVAPRFKPYFDKVKAEVRALGIVEGKHEKSITIAEKMLVQNNFTDGQIVYFTELKLKEVLSIKKRLIDIGLLAKN